MKWVMTYICGVLLIATFLAWMPIRIPDHMKVELSTDELAYKEAFNVDISNQIVKVLSALSLSYVMSFESSDYMPQSQSDYLFSRSWHMTDQLVWDKAPKIELLSHLLIDDEGRYFILVNYRFDDIGIGTKNHFFEINHGTQITLDARSQGGSMIFGNSAEYRFGNGMIYRQGNFFQLHEAYTPQYFKHAIYDGYTLFEVLAPTVDFIHVHIQMFECISISEHHAQLGFNVYKSTQPKKYVVNALELIYLLEDN